MNPMPTKINIINNFKTDAQRHCWNNNNGDDDDDLFSKFGKYFVSFNVEDELKLETIGFVVVTTKRSSLLDPVMMVIDDGVGDDPVCWWLWSPCSSSSSSLLLLLLWWLFWSNNDEFFRWRDFRCFPFAIPFDGKTMSSIVVPDGTELNELLVLLSSIEILMRFMVLVHWAHMNDSNTGDSKIVELSRKYTKRKISQI